VNGPAFIVGWWIGLAVVGAIVLSVSSGAGATDEGAPATWVDVLKLVLGLLLLLVSLRQWRGRPHGSEEPPTPKWMGALDGRIAELEADVRRRLEDLGADTEAARAVLEARLQELVRRFDATGALRSSS